MIRRFQLSLAREDSHLAMRASILRRLSTRLGFLLPLLGASPILAQETQTTTLPVLEGIQAVAAADVLGRTFTAHLEGVTLREALALVSARTGVRFAYSASQLPINRRVSLVADRITVHDALAILLLDTGFEAVAFAPGAIRLEPKSPLPLRLAYARQGAGTIAGRVTDAKTGQPLADAAVAVEGTNRRAVATPGGRYAIAGIPAGAYKVTVRTLGYVRLAKAATVLADSITPVDFALEPVAARLDEIVTTGAGQQRRVELGNAVATLNADSVAKTAPINNLTDLISGRIPNVEVVQTNGLAGSGPAVRIRGRGSLTLSNDPIYVVDGVRMDGSPGGLVDAFNQLGFAGTGSNPTASRLNDVDPNEIETIEVLRGPSASTEYGTDAANGVVVITTKRGHGGAPRWSATVEQGLSTMPVHFADNYYSWGHLTSGTHGATKCPLVPSPFPFSPPFGAPGSTAGQCTVDSVTRWQPLNHAQTSLFGTGHRGRYELQVSGGGGSTQYFLAGGLTSEIGDLQMPPTEAARIAREREQAVPRDQLRPNALLNGTARTRLTTALGSTADLSFNAAYARNDQRSPNEDGLLFNALASPGIRDSLSGYGGYAPFRLQYTPGTDLANTGSERVSRLTSGLTPSWRPLPWLTTRATVGLDEANRTDVQLTLPGQGHFLPGSLNFTSFGQVGYRSVGQYTTNLYTVDLGASAVASPSANVSAKTAVGLQYNDHRTSGSAVGVVSLAIGNPTLNGANVVQQLESNDESATLGSYVEETIGFFDRLFLIGAARIDAGSGFGKSYKSAVYPKASVSWVVLPPEARTSLRLRAAYGQSGVQPPPGSSLQLYAPGQRYDGTQFVPVLLPSTIGVPGLRPEQTAETEGGFDLGLFGQRVQVEATGYEKLSRDALISVPTPGSLGGTSIGTASFLGGSLIGSGSVLENVGSVRNFGIEMSVTAQLVQARALAWDVTVSGSDNENRLVHLAPGVAPIDQTSFFEGPYKQQPGYPLFGLWAYGLHYSDLNHDHVIEPNEVSVDAQPSFVGPSLAPRQVSVSSGVTLLGGRVRLAGQLDHRSGQHLMNVMSYISDGPFFTQLSRATNDPRTPLALQARAVAHITDSLFRLNSGYVEPASFTRLRELSLTYFASPRLAALLRAQTLSLTVAGRNLALWTKYTGSDPEVSTVQGHNQGVSAGGVPATTLNPDLVGDFGAVPQSRYWTLKVNVGL